MAELCPLNILVDCPPLFIYPLIKGRKVKLMILNNNNKHLNLKNFTIYYFYSLRICSVKLRVCMKYSLIFIYFFVLIN